ncbi:MAG: CapA family protein [Actinomycetota bacterium]
MSHQDILILAKQGDSRAIAFLINQALRNKGVVAKATRQDYHLHILLEAESLPAQDACLRVIENGLWRLQSPVLRSVTLYGRRMGQQLPTWTQTLELKPPFPFQGTAGTRPQKAVSPRVVATAPVPPSPPQEPVIISQPPVAQVQSSRDQPRGGSGHKTQTPWLLAGSVSLILLPLSGLVVNSQLQKILTPLSTAQETPTPKPQNLPSPATAPQTPPSKTLTPPIKTSLPPKKAPLAPATTITIKAVGDIIPGTNYPYNKLPKQKEQLFESVKPYLQGADILFGNFESTLTDYAYSSKSVGGGQLFAFRTPPTYRQLLKATGFNILNVANNHSYDFNEQGFKDTINNIDSAGMRAVGKRGQIVYKEVKGVTVAFIGFSNYGDVHNSLLELKESQAIIKQARTKAEIVVVSVHAGAEGTGALKVRNQNEFFLGENRGNMVLFSHTMIDAGADLVLGHGPHVARALELYKGKLIAYSLGNFVGYRTLSTAAELGQSLILEVKVNPKGEFVAGKIIPVELDGRGIPYIDNDFKSVGLIRKLTQDDFPDTPLKIDEGGRILKK